MAKGKKSGAVKYTSNGERPSVTRKTRNAVRSSRTFSERRAAQMDAWKKGKRVMLTVANPNTNQTNKRFIRVEACDVWGDPNSSLRMPSINKQMGK